MWNSFWTLSRTRSNTGFGIGAISYQEMLAFIHLEGFTDEEDVEELLYFIPNMDNLFLEKVRENQKREKEDSRSKRQHR